jgi:hypothetical protein
MTIITLTFTCGAIPACIEYYFYKLFPKNLDYIPSILYMIKIFGINSKNLNNYIYVRYSRYRRCC